MPSENLPALSCRMKAAEILFSRSGENTPPDEENTDESYQVGAIRWVKKFCLGRSSENNMSATMNSTMAAIAIIPATLRFLIILYLRCRLLVPDILHAFLCDCTHTSVIASLGQ